VVIVNDVVGVVVIVNDVVVGVDVCVSELVVFRLMYCKALIKLANAFSSKRRSLTQFAG
jgi:hypothetical protein